MLEPAATAYLGDELRRLAGSLENVGFSAEETAFRFDPPQPGGFAVELALAPRAATVRLRGWTRRFELGEDADHDRDQADLCLDLVAAALFGVVRLVIKTVDREPHAWTLQIRDGEGWSVVSSSGRPSLNPFARRETVVLVNAVPRPATHPAATRLGLPWAPWAGAGGFSPIEEPKQGEVQLPVDGVLDLHNFSPKEIKPLLLEYIEQCHTRGISQLRIIHGKGTGQLRRTVHALLDGDDRVAGYRLGGHGGGSWGATIVDLKARADP